MKPFRVKMKTWRAGMKTLAGVNEIDGPNGVPGKRAILKMDGMTPR